MNPERWQQVKQILDTALEMPPGERDLFIEKISGGEKSLRDDVKSFLAYQSTAANFMQAPAIEVAGRALASNGFHSMSGRKLGHFLILEKLGSGGMGEVYLAKDLALGRQAAIKVLAPGAPPGFLNRLMHEAEAAVKLQHPAIATFFESGTDGYTAYIAMEYVAGETLRSRLSRGPLGVSSTMTIAMGLLEALAHAHMAGVLHRDIKPENIMLVREDMPKLLDFGLAIQLMPGDSAETQSSIRGVIAGTLGYMSPEQVRGEPDLDERSDLFSLGAVLYEALSGQPAFPGNTGADRLAALLYKDPPPLASLGFSSAISDIVHRSLEKERDRRFYSAAAFLKELQQLGDAPVRAGSLNTLAIMEFKNLSLDSADDWLGTGIAETLTTDLAQLPGVKIAPRERIVQSHRSASSEKPDPLSVAQTLGCRWVLDGSFQKLGSMIRITARLTEVATLRVAATEKLDGSVEQFFAMQDRLSASVANSLQCQVPVLPSAGSRPILTAYEYYNRGRQFFLGYKKGGFQRAESLYQEAIGVDPRYALAHAGLASISAMKWTFTSNPADLEAAKQHAYRAIELNPSLGEPHIWLGYALFRSGQLEEALDEERKAKGLDPSNHMALYFEGLILKDLGRLDEAIAAFQECIKIEPQFTGSWGLISHSYMVLDKSEEAIWCLQHVIQLEKEGNAAKSEFRAVLAEMHRRTGNISAGKAACLSALESIESSDSMYRDHLRADCLNVLGRCALTEGDLQAASAAFHQIITQIRGRPQTSAAGFFMAQALAGEARATGNQKLLEEASQIFRSRVGWNFSSGSGNMDGEVAVDIGMAAAALGRSAEAREWYEYARQQIVSRFRLSELEKAIAANKVKI
jgi:serine/threonine protein kinase